MAINIRQKGASGERELATELNMLINVVRLQLGMPVAVEPIVQRNQNQSAVGGCDLVGTFGFAIEVKRQENLSINTWWKQCLKSAEDLEEVPVLIFRQNGKKWRVILLADVPVPGTGRFHLTRCEITFEDFEGLFKAAVRHHYEAVLAQQKSTQPAPGEQGLF